MFKRFLIVTITLIIVFAGATPQTSHEATRAQEMEPIKIGAIFDLTGATSDVGQFYAQGMLGYVDWMNANGGLDGHPIEMISQDYAYSVETAENLYVEFVNQGVVVFQGWGTGDTEALRGRIAEDEIPFMSASYSATLGDPAEAPYNFLVGTSYSDQAIILMQAMLDEWVEEGYTAEEMKVAFFHNDSPFGTSPLDDAEAWAAEHGIATVRVPMPRGATGFDAEITTNVVEAEATHIIIQNVSSPAALLVRNLGDLGLLDFVQVGCLNWCADELLVNGAGDYAEGVMGALPFAPTSVEREGQADSIAWLEEVDGPSLEEATLHYTQGWWTMTVMMEGVRLTLDAGQELTGANIKANLETLTDFETGGVTAPITFTAEDHRGNRALHVYRVEDGLWVEASDLIDLRAMEDME